jgi:2-polyprenyl-3-methyl-5-hydroxy-6-metoxy-1,4-benzoquinol methylase
MSHVVRDVLKRILPAEVRAGLRGAGALRRELTTAALDRARYGWYRARLARAASRVSSTIDYAQLRNILPNSGPAPLTNDYASAREVLGRNRRGVGTYRQLGIQHFEGMAADDAVFDPETEGRYLWRCAGLAGIIADFAFHNYRHPAILELGSGPGLLFTMLRRYGIANYVGIDGNPLSQTLNPHLAGQEAHFLLLNLQDEIRLSQRDEPLWFDIVCSFEVLEHIPEHSIDNLLGTMRRHMHPRSVAFLTASLKPTSQVDVHVLVRDRGWWLSRFLTMGLHEHVNAARLSNRLKANHPWNWNSSDTNIFVLTTELHGKRGIGAAD